MREEPRRICRHCSGEDCYEHCQKTEDGLHALDPHSAQTSAYDDDRILVDVCCRHCGVSGSTSLGPDDITW